MAGNKDDLPSVTEFGQWRAKMARRGVPQAWIDKVLGTSINGRTRGEIALDLSEGYNIGQINGPNALRTVFTHLQAQGWDVSEDPDTVHVRRSDGTEYDLLGQYLLDCDFSDLPGPLASDVRQALHDFGICP